MIGYDLYGNANTGGLKCGLKLLND